MIVAEGSELLPCQELFLLCPGRKPQESFEVSANLDMKRWVGGEGCGWGLA